MPTRGTGWDRLLFRCEHWLLSPGGTEMGRLRGYLHMRDWRQQPSAAARARAVVAGVKLPARALRDAWQAVRQHGAPARAAGASTARQLAQLWWIRVRHAVRPEVYYCFQLYRPGQLRRAASFFQAGEDGGLFRLVNVRTALDQAELTLDKARFEEWLVAQGLPTTRTLAEFAEGRVTRTALPDGRIPPYDLFVKPNDLLEGRGAEVWPFDGEGWTGPDGRRRSEAELLAELAERSAAQGLLLQERMRNDPALAPIAPYALSTVRVLTVRDVDGAVRVVVAVCKIPVGTAPTDHMRLGGVAAPVELETGRLRQAVGKAPGGFTAPCLVHPDTGTPIEGFQLPQWDAALRLAVRAHEALDRLVCIGWDIAILERGPVIIEANDNPGHASSQLPTGVGLGETAVARAVLARLEASFAGR